MKSVQRKFGTLMKRSDNEKDVQTVLAEFKAMDDMLDRVWLEHHPHVFTLLTSPIVDQRLQSLAHFLRRYLKIPV